MKVRGYQFYAVEGRGNFPMDMLRYDESEPYAAHDGSRTKPAAADKMATDDVYHPRRVRVLMRVKEGGYGFTPARWSSFGWNVVACAKTMSALSMLLQDQPIPYAPPDGYTHLYSVPVVAETALDMKNEQRREERTLAYVTDDQTQEEIRREEELVIDFDAERKTFEAWVMKQWGSLGMATDNMWLAWQGRARHQATLDNVPTN